jgi:PIN domain nuclease of toxin-antitoxin system
VIVLDASAVLAVMLGEPGGQTMAQRLSGSLMGVANLSEVLAKVAERGMDPRDYQAGLSALGVEFAPVTTAQAIDAAVLRPLTAHLGLSLGDRLCLALARERRLPVLTTERRWLEYDFGVRVEYGR